MLTRRQMLTATGTTALCIASTAQSQPAAYPSKPIRFYCGFPPGGVADIVARAIAPVLSHRLGQPVIVDNRAGVGGALAVDAVAKSAADGYTMGFGVAGALTSGVTLMKLPYDPVRDIAPVSMVVIIPIVLAVAASSTITNLKEFIATSKSEPGGMTYGTAGPGTVMNLAGEMLKQMAAFDMRHVPYKGSSPAVTDLLGGHVGSVLLDWTTVKPHVQAGRLRVIAQTGARRSSVIPDVPTIAEAGVPGYDFTSWFGLVVPAGTPAPILSRVHADLSAALRDPVVRSQLLAAGTDPTPTSPHEFELQIRREIESTARLIKSASIKID